MSYQKKHVFYTELAKLVDAGFGIREAAGVMLESRPSPAERRTLDGILHGLDDGRSIVDSFEHVLLDASRQSEQTGQVILDPRFTQEFMGRLDTTLRAAFGHGAPPVLLVPTPVRFFVKRLVEPSYPNLAVMGYTEVSSTVRIQSAGTVVTHGFAQPAEQAVG